MRPRVPILPTVLVVAAALLMVRLGLWQLNRLHEKEALLARFAANAGRPPLPFAALFPVREADLYRRASVTCLGAGTWTAESGRNAAGVPGWRHIAACRTGAEGPGVMVDLGVSQASVPPRWTGGRVAGRITWAPSSTPLIARLVGTPPVPTPMIVSEVPAPGLQPSQQPDPAAIPNNHLSYAVQWFIFAGLAIVIYVAALWQRERRTDRRD